MQMRNKFKKSKEINKNIALFDFLLFPFIYFQQKLYDLRTIKTVVKNWPEVILFRIKLKKKFTIMLKDGKKIKIDSMDRYFNFWNSFWKSGKSLTLLKKAKIKKKNKIELRYKNHLIEFYFIDAGIITEQFIQEQYKWLNVKGKEVVDVGANIGDTAIYFVINGAKHVYAFEPYPFSYKIALKNIKLNKLKKKVTLLNEAIGKENKTIYIDENYKNTGSDDLKEFKKGKKIRVTTLKEVVKRFKLKDAVLKMDCEGCEYNSILNTPNKVLRNFEQIMLEYHIGYLNLKKKLEEAGFKVKVSQKGLKSGLLYAQRLSKARKS